MTDKSLKTSTLDSVATLGDGHALLAAPRAREILAALNDSSYLPQAMFVGGCVRGALLGEAVADIDIATLHMPEEATKLLQQGGYKVIPTGIEHGTVTAVKQGQSFEITTLRKDVETDGRRAVVAFSKDWREDALRRDFTLNTLLCDANGNIFDPLGSGYADLKARRVVFVGQAEERIKEDYLRILRFFRFWGRYGQGAPDAQAMKACRDAADKLETLSKERVSAEIFKILMHESAPDVLGLMFKNNILPALCSPEFKESILKALIKLQNEWGAPDLSARLIGLAGCVQSVIEEFNKHLLLTKAMQREIKLIFQTLAMDLNTEHGVQEAIYKCGNAAALQAMLLKQASAPENGREALIELTKSWQAPCFPLSGEDLMREGYKPGPELGRELAKREAAWIARGFRQP